MDCVRGNRSMRKNLFFVLAGIFFIVMAISLFAYMHAKDNIVYHMAVSAFKRGDHENAFEAFSALADKGDVRAMGAVGLMYVRGLGVRVDETVGAAWLARAADEGDAEAMHSLGELYENGQGVPRSRVIALALYLNGARLGNEMARVFSLRLEPQMSTDDVSRAKRMAERFAQNDAVSVIIERNLKKRNEP